MNAHTQSRKSLKDSINVTSDNSISAITFALLSSVLIVKIVTICKRTNSDNNTTNIIQEEV